MIRIKLLGVALVVLLGTAILVAEALPSAGQVPRTFAATNHGSVKIVGAGANCAFFCFTPANVTIHQAGTVTWSNVSGTEHTVSRCTTTACNGVSGGTGGDPSFNHTMLAGSTFTLTFHKAGTYVYYCMIHGYALMHGKVTVLPFAVATSSMPAGTVGVAYSKSLGASGGKLPVHWSISAGALPQGLTLSGNTISGTPTAAGTFKFTVKAVDSSVPALVATRALSIVVS
jgi:plastocyanin